MATGMYSNGKVKSPTAPLLMDKAEAQRQFREVSETIAIRTINGIEVSPALWHKKRQLQAVLNEWNGDFAKIAEEREMELEGVIAENK